ncbi:MAG: L-aspartate oxidase [Methanomassiliicoccales archaeon PtaU1.Bin124]|nr:MAG: L-aspartate oxidase [Methanomassiliicoccales archaeon PtaU1.Bin124]
MVHIAPDDVMAHDVAIVGGGLTGLRAALLCAEKGRSVAVISKVHPLRSHSVAAQGGVNASLNNATQAGKDSWQSHAFDTVKGADYLADQEAVDILCGDAPRAVLEMEHMGAVFSRNEEGRIAQRPFGGAGFPRTCYAADHTGHTLLHTLYEQCMSHDIDFFEEHFVTALSIENGRCAGLCAFDLASGEMRGFEAGAVLLATGGYGRIYCHSTNAYINTGDGAYLALTAGAALKDMEFVQFHPTTLFGTNILISEAARGEGGVLLNAKGERFMQRYAAKAMELAPRDIVARAIWKEVQEGNAHEGGYVDLDLTHLGEERILERLPGIRQISIDFAGVDPVDEMVPVQPGQHYSMGGIDASNDCRTSIPGLLAAGEASCISVHGANRLGGNSLLETIVFGKVAGQTMVGMTKEHMVHDPARLKDLMRREADSIGHLTDVSRDRTVAELRRELKKLMFHHFGIFRDKGTMKLGQLRVHALRHELGKAGIDDIGKSYNQAVIEALELRSMLPVAEAVAISALAREESRGSHYRTDFPQRNDQDFLKHSMVTMKDGALALTYAPVRLGRYEVRERVY